MKFLLIVLIFLLLNSLLIISNHNLAIYKSGNAEKFGVLWLEWLSKVFSNFKALTGNAVSLDWTS